MLQSVLTWPLVISAVASGILTRLLGNCSQMNGFVLYLIFMMISYSDGYGYVLVFLCTYIPFPCDIGGIIVLFLLNTTVAISPQPLYATIFGIAYKNLAKLAKNEDIDTWWWNLPYFGLIIATVWCGYEHDNYSLTYIKIMFIMIVMKLMETWKKEDWYLFLFQLFLCCVLFRSYSYNHDFEPKISQHKGFNMISLCFLFYVDFFYWTIKTFPGRDVYTESLPCVKNEFGVHELFILSIVILRIIGCLVDFECFVFGIWDLCLFVSKCYNGKNVDGVRKSHPDLMFTHLLSWKPSFDCITNFHKSNNARLWFFRIMIFMLFFLISGYTNPISSEVVVLHERGFQLSRDIVAVCILVINMLVCLDANLYVETALYFVFLNMRLFLFLFPPTDESFEKFKDGMLYVFFNLLVRKLFAMVAEYQEFQHG